MLNSSDLTSAMSDAWSTLSGDEGRPRTRPASTQETYQPTNFPPMEEKQAIVQLDTNWPLDLPVPAVPIHELLLAWALVVRAHTCTDTVVFGTDSEALVAVHIDIDQSLHRHLEILAAQRTVSAASSRSTSGFATPLTDVSYVPATRFRSAVLGSRTAWSPIGGAPLTFVCGTSPEVVFDSSIVDPLLLRHVVAQFQRAVRAIHGAEPQRLVRDVSLVDAADLDTAQSLAGPVSIGSTSCMHDLIVAHTRQRPQAPASEGWDAMLTYAELDERSDALAVHLCNLGLRAGDVVATCLDKSAWVPVIYLAVLKAGAAVTTLNHTMPVPQLQSIIDNVKATIILASSRHHYKLQGLAANLLDIVPQLERLPSKSFLPARVTHHDAAYIISTSGTTGKPKQIVIDHGAICSALNAMSGPLGITAGTRTLQFSAYTWDVSMGDIFFTLGQGACLCTPSEHERMNDLEIACRRMRPTLATLTPTVADLLEPHQLPGIQTLVLGGEALTSTNVRNWAPHKHLVNVYGPSEASVWVTATDKLHEGSDPADIGRAQGVAAWVIDPDDPNRLAPIGAIGELLLEGPAVGSGYLNNPKATAAAFVERPTCLPPSKFSTSRETRCYRTGDLVRFNLASGTLLYVRRADGQAKVAGQRLELGSVEDAIRRSSDKVKHATVAAPHRGLCNNRLVGILHFQGTADSGRPLEVESEPHADVIGVISKYLSSHLAPYMIPSIWFAVSGIPTSASGKLDRPAITNWVESMDEKTFSMQIRHSETEGRVKANTTTETLLQQIIGDVLHIKPETVVLDKSFLATGGDSLRAMQIIASCTRHGLSIDVPALLSDQTLADLAAFLDSPTTVVNQNSVATFDSFSSLGLDAPRLQSFKSRLDKVATADQIEACFPTLPAQEGVLISQVKGTGIYNMLSVWELSGAEATREQLESAWIKVARRHPALRTTFFESDRDNGMFDQIVWKTPAVDVVTLPWLGANNKDHLERTAGGWTNAQPPHRLTLRNAPDGRVHLELLISHAVVDGLSVAVIRRELERALQGTLEQTPTPRYSEYMRHQQNQDTAQARTFWRSYLGGMDGCLMPKLTSWGTPVAKVCSVRRPLPQGPQLRHFCRSRSVTLFNLLQAAWAVTLRAYTSSDDVCFAFLSTDRHFFGEHADKTIGFFLNMVPCRVTLTGTSSVVDMLKQVRNDFLSTLPHQHLGLGAIARECGVPAEQLFNTAMTFFDADVAPSEGEVHLRQVLFQDTSEYDIVVKIHEAQDDTVVELCYSNTALSDTQAENVLGVFLAAAQNLTQAETVDAVDLLDDRMRTQILDWNRDLPPAIDACMHDMFRESAKKNPLALAIDAHDGRFTYRELDETTDRLAARLRQLGVTADSAVALCMQQSAWATVAMLGTLKAGGKFVPIDPRAPVERAQYIIDNTGARILLTLVNTPTLDLRNLAHTLQLSNEMISQMPAGHALRFATPRSVAYICHTSGSTGVPKGVAVEHRSMTSSMMSHADIFRVGPESRVLQFTSYSFDVSLAEIFTTLLRGGCICVPSDYERLDNLAGAFSRLSPTVAYFVPSALNSLRPEECPSLQTLICGGEAMTLKIKTLWGPHVQLINAYGPTEATVFSLCINTSDPLVPPENIGRALGCRAWIVRPGHPEQLMPVGAAGELMIEGPIVAREYHNDPVRTNKVFLENATPWTSTPGGRGYCTGDLVRYEDNGTIRYIGRQDNQVKIAGQRTELGEIEGPIIAEADIAHAVVHLPKRGACQKKLVAVVSLHKSEGVAEAGLDHDIQRLEFNSVKHVIEPIRERLGEKLAVYMVPTIWIPVTRLPLTVAGKLNRRLVQQWIEKLDVTALGDVLQVDVSTAVTKTPTEAMLAEIWAQTLQMTAEQIPLNRSFFNVGGDSVLAMAVVSESRRRGLDVSARSIIRGTSIAELAKALAPAQQEEQKSVVLTDSSEFRKMDFPLLRTTDESWRQLQDEITAKLGSCSRDLVEDIYPCSLVQEGILASQSIGTSPYTIDITWKVQTRDPVDVSRLQNAWRTVVQRHAALRAVHIEGAMAKEAFLTVVLRNPSLTVKTCHISEDEVSSLETRAELPSFPAPAHQLIVAETSSRNAVYVHLKISHALVDGFSLDILQNDLAHAYTAQAKNMPVQNTRVFSNYIEFLQNQDRVGSLDFWKNTLQGVRPCHFPVLQHDADALAKKCVLKSTIDNTTALQRVCRQHNVSMANLAQLAWALVLRAYTGESDVCFGYMTAGRDAPVAGLDNAVGVFLNLLVSRCQLADQTVAAALDVVRDNFADSLDHQHVSLARVQGALGLDGKALFNTGMSCFRESESESDSGVSIVPVHLADTSEYGITLKTTYTKTRFDITLTYFTNILSSGAAAAVHQAFVETLLWLPENLTRDVAMASSGPLQTLYEIPTNSQGYWAKALSQTQPCYFPSLSDEGQEQHRAVTRRSPGDAIRKFCQTRDVSPDSTFQLAWALVLRAFVGSDDVCFGYAGMGIDTMPCCVRFNGDQPTLNILHQLAARQQDNMLRRCTLKEINQEMGLGEKGLFNTSVSLQGHVNSDFDKWAVGLDVVHTQYSLELSLSYSTSFLSDIQASTVLDAVLQALGAIIQDSPMPCVDLIDDASRRVILQRNSVTLPAAETTVPELIARHVKTSPAAPSLVSWDGVMTYRELDAASDRLAAHLARYGVTTGVTVPLCFHKTMWAVVAILAVLKTGAAYVPLDPSAPAERVQRILEQLPKVKVALAAPAHIDKLGQAVPTVVALDDKFYDKLMPVARFRTTAQPSDAAYIIFTSGSTGVPKGVVVEHRAICTSMLAHGAMLRLTSDTRTLQFSSLAFDVSVGEILTTLVFGGCVCIPSDEERTNALSAAINRMNVSCAWLTPAVAVSLEPADVPCLRTMLTGADLVGHAVIQKWGNGPCRLIQGYGLTETSVMSTASDRTSQAACPEVIGTPLGCAAWVVDPRDPHCLVPQGAVGELLIQGPIQARGYLNDPVKTASAFLHGLPWLTDKNERVYRTGDLVRQDMNGVLSFVRRKDTQVKVGGHRVELGEIDYQVSSAHADIDTRIVLLASEGVFRGKIVVVLTFRDLSTRDDDCLQLLEVVDQEKAQPKLAEIHQALATKLPQYMQPSAVLVVNALPTNLSGKIDARQVTAWVHTMARETYDRVMGISRDEQMVEPTSNHGFVFRAAVATVLDKPESDISMGSSFIRLGGDSISAIQVVSHLRRASIVVSVQDLLRASSLAALTAQTGSDQLADHQVEMHVNDPVVLPFEIPEANLDYWQMSQQTDETSLEGSFSLPADITTALLRESNRVLRATCIDILLAVAGHSFSVTFDRPCPAIFETQNQAHAVPWVVSFGRDFLDAVRWVHDMRAMTSDAAVKALAAASASGPVEILLTMLADKSRPATPDALIQLYATLVDNSLTVSWTVDARLGRREQLNQWFKSFSDALTELSLTMQSARAELTRVDMPLLPLKHEHLIPLNQKLHALPSYTSVETVLPLLPTQRGILMSKAKGDATYDVHILWAISARKRAVDPVRLQRAWNRVVSRHPMLRTVFLESVDESALFDQVILTRSNPSTAHVMDDEADHASAVDQLWDAAQGEFSSLVPWHRLALCARPDGSVLAHLQISHALIDATSLAVIRRDWTNAYDDALDPGSNTSCERYIAHIQRTPVADSIAFWRQRLQGLTPSLLPRREDTVAVSKLCTLELEIEAANDLKMIARRLNVSMASLFQLAWAMVLQAYAGSQDVCFGYVVSARDTDVDGLADAVGPLLNTLVTRVVFEAGTTVASALQNMFTSYLDSLPHQHVSFADVKRAADLGPERLFNTGMTFANASMDLQTQTSLSFDMVRHQDPSESDLVLKVIEGDAGIQVLFTHWTSAISEDQVVNLSTCLVQALRIIQEPETRLDAYNLVPAEHISQMLTWNKDKTNPVTRSVLDQFHDVCHRTPHATAVAAWDREFTYAELEELSTRLASHLLRNYQIRVGDYIVLCYEKSAWAVVSLMAAFKIGAPALLFETSVPVERLQVMTRQIGASIALCSSENQNLVRQCGLAPIVVNEVSVITMRRQPVILPEVPLSRPAYIIFTSGTTGTPKGVVIEHGSLSAAMAVQGKALGMEATSRVIDNASYAFDASIGVLIFAFGVGGCLCIPRRQDALNNLAETIARMDINCGTFSSSFLRTLEPGTFPPHMKVWQAGEAMTQHVIDTWGSRVKLFNVYGPTEGTIISNVNPKVATTGPANIGHSTSAALWVADSENVDKLVPIGCAGELLLEGPGLSRGYLGDEAKTAAAFVSGLAWAKQMGRGEHRFYRTGDIVRANPDGSINFIGRKDQQVKINGQRMELGEIEYHLSSHDLVHHVLVLSPSVGPLSKRLVAVLSLDGLSDNSATETRQMQLLEASERQQAEFKMQQLRMHLASKVPSYMVPSTWIVARSLPTMVSGKLDRAFVKKWLDQLEANVYTQIENTDASVPLHVDEKVALAVSNKLDTLLSTNGRPSMAGTNFVLMKHGLESITAISVSNWIRKTYSVNVPISTLLSPETDVRTLAGLIDPSSKALVPVRQSSATSTSSDEINLKEAAQAFDDKLAQLSVPDHYMPSRTPKAFLVTGATGFLGSQIVRQLLRRRDVTKVVCLVRATDEEHAMQRVMQAARNGLWWQAEFQERIEAWKGDLSQPRLGLTDAQWARIGAGPKTGAIDAVIHNGAVVHWQAGYSAMREANVDSTCDLLAAWTGAPAPPAFSYIAGGYFIPANESDEDVMEKLQGRDGYSQTKYVSDFLVRQHGQRICENRPALAPPQVVRPGLIIGDAEHGVSNTDDFLWRVVASALRIGGYNAEEDSEAWLLVAGSDQIATAAIDACMQGAQAPDFRFTDGMPINDLWRVLAHEFCHTLKPMTAKEWLQRLEEDIAAEGTGHPLFPVFNVLQMTNGYLGVSRPSGMPISAPEDVRLRVSQSIRYLHEVGYLKCGAEEKFSGVTRERTFQRSL